MKNAQLWKICRIQFLALMVLTISIHARAADTYLPSSLIAAETIKMRSYTKEFQLYVDNCESVDSSKLSKDQLKQCIANLKDLRVKYDTCLQTYEAVISKIKEANKWTKELDDDFYKRASSQIAGEVRQAGGLRQALLTTGRDLAQDKANLDIEMRSLEEQYKKVASVNTVQFRLASYEPDAFMNFIQRAVSKLKKAVEELCIEVECNMNPA